MNHFNNKVQFAFSSRKYGPMNTLGHRMFDGERIANRRAFLSDKFDRGFFPCVMAKLEHGGKALIIEHGPQDEDWISKSDALITGKKEFVLAVGGADCPSVVLYDPIKEVLAVAHCGWKPLVNNILLNTVGKMIKDFNCDPMSIQAYIGPGACADCYEVKDDVGTRFPFGCIKRSGDGRGKIFLNLGLVIESQLVDAGVSVNNIDISGECTMHDVCTGDEEPKYYSWRRDHEDPLNTGVMVAFMT